MFRLALGLVCALALAKNVIAKDQGINPRTFDALRALASAHSQADVQRLSQEFHDVAGTPILWRDAVRLASRSDEAGIRIATVRLLDLAVSLNPAAGGNTPALPGDASSWDSWSHDDLVTLRRATGGFPFDTDLLLYLLDRKPNLIEQYTGEYTVIRIVERSERHQILERLSVPKFDLGREFTQREFSAGNDPVHLELGERETTRRFVMAALPQIILAAKAYTVAERAALPYRPYAIYIAAQALQRADAAEAGKMALVARAAVARALREAKATKGDTVLTEMAHHLSFELASAEFFAHRFPQAAKAYHDTVPADATEKVLRVWGEGLSQFAAGNYVEASIPFDTTAGLLGDSTGADIHTYLLKLLLDALTDPETRSWVKLNSWKQRVRMSMARSGQPDSRQLLEADLQFKRLMKTIGRADLAIPHFARRLKESYASKKDSNRSELESVYLYQIGVLTRQLFYEISFKMSDSRGWQPRERTDYAKQWDFIDEVSVSKGPIMSMEVTSSNKKLPYAMLDPEEDYATTFSAYVGDQELDSIGREILRSLQETRPPIAEWAVAALARTSGPSVVPYLKVIWMEWFGTQFEELKEPESGARTFVYRPSNVSGLASSRQVANLARRRWITDDQRNLIREMLSLHDLLLSRYPPSHRTIQKLP